MKISPHDLEIRTMLAMYKKLGDISTDLIYRYTEILLFLCTKANTMKNFIKHINQVISKNGIIDVVKYSIDMLVYIGK